MKITHPRKIINKRLKSLKSIMYSSLASANDIINALNESWKNLNRINWELSYVEDLNSLITHAEIEENGQITVFVSIKGTKYLREIDKAIFENFKLNRFFQESLPLIAHELRHREQYKQDKTIFDISKDLSGKEYFAQEQEIDAYAYQAAVEINEFDESPTIERYVHIFGLRNPVTEKLLLLVKDHLR